ncbi:MAG: hypothetical protein NC231_12640 [Bacillus sp. (in: Bacteria)]|nr:hypothetical protein [Bacillus sp. (in: firmicutes)]MCM1427898.1 hypothetical protein [Eubacterium sp.]
MNSIQDNMLPEHHVMKCIFHNHDTGQKKKMLGGVSFDGGASSGSGRGSHTVTQAGGQTVQPPFYHVNPAAGFGNGISVLGQAGGNGISALEQAEGNGKAQHSAGHPKDTVSISVIPDRNEAVADVGWPIEKQRPRFSYKKYIGRLKNGIHTFLESMEQKAGKEKKEQPKKKKENGTRAITKEEVYEIQINTAYLLDSYNKHGQRSTLGK